MNDLIVSLLKVDSKSTLASLRIARFLSETLKLPIKDSGNGVIDKHRFLFIVNGPPAFCNWREEIAAMVKKCEAVVWVNNDYTIAPPSQVGKVMRERGWVNDKGHIKSPIVWSTISDKVTRRFDEYINWNQLTYDPKPIMRDKDARVFYYGAYRVGREDLFKTYFGKNGKYPVDISCSLPAGKRFALLNSKASIHPPFKSLYDEFGRVGCSIYIEDKYSNIHYCSPANRFYECLGAGIPVLMDASSLWTFQQAGMKDMENWLVCDSKDVLEFMSASPYAIAKEQRKLFDQDYVGDLRMKIRKAYRGLVRDWEK